LNSFSSSSSSSPFNSLWKNFLIETRTNLEPSWQKKWIHKRQVWIQTQDTPNPESLKFLPGEKVLPISNESVKTMDFPTARSALASPLAKELFSLDGVKGVLFGNDFITVTKDSSAQWSVLKSLVFSTIQTFYMSGKPLILGEFDQSPAEKSTIIQPEDNETVAMIKEILETRVRPGVQEDGGDIQYKGFQDGVVYLKMQGSCSGCPSSAITLKSGIEKMLMHWVPEVTGVVAVELDEDLDKLNLEHFKKVEENIEMIHKNNNSEKKKESKVCNYYINQIKVA